jgi:beta-aspartyl-peptidase (threonine type)
MLRKILFLLLLTSSWAAPAQTMTVAKPAPTAKTGPITLVIHGGAGTINRSNMTAAKEQAYTAALNQALEAGYIILKKGGTALDAVEAAVRFMEDSPLFNAGKGAVFTHEGRNELDAAIMDGQTMKAGAVAGVTVVRNPITAARAVMEKSEHVMLAGPGAEQFARDKGLAIVAPGYFRTEPRYEQLQKALEKEQGPATANPAPAPAVPVKSAPAKTKLKVNGGKPQSYEEDNIFVEGKKYGTVGAVALDQYGNLAAATSTGGMTNKRYGRIGDAPIIGAGTYADNASCAVSCTGWGEYFIRATVARDVAARMEFQKVALAEAAQASIDKVEKLGGDGGLIALDREGNIAMPFNSEGMYRAYINASGEVKVLIYK